MWEDSLFSTSFPAFVICRLFDYDDYDWCEVVYLIVVLIFTCLIISDVELAICMSSFSNVYLDLLPFSRLDCFLFLLSCMSCLYLLKIKPLLVTSFTNIFSQFVGCLFILIMVSFAM